MSDAADGVTARDAVDDLANLAVADLADGGRLPSGLAPGDARGQLSSLYGIFVLGSLMFQRLDEREILRLALDAVKAVSQCDVAASFTIDEVGRLVPTSTSVSERLTSAVREGPHYRRRLDLGPGWHYALYLRGAEAIVGCLVVRSDGAPDDHERFLLEALTLPTGAALAAARAVSKLNDQSAELRRIGEARERAAAELKRTVDRLEAQSRAQSELSAVSAAGGAEGGIAAALHRLTGHPVVIRDSLGYLKAAAGAGDDVPTRASATQWQRTVAAVRSADEPVRLGDRLLAPARAGGNLHAVASLLGLDRSVPPEHAFALQYGMTVLAGQLAHRRSLAEAETRLQRELADDLLAGIDDAAAIARAEPLGHDLRVPQQVVVMHWGDRPTEHLAADAIDRALRRAGVAALVARRPTSIVAVAAGVPQPDRLLAELRRLQPRVAVSVGIGSRVARPSDVPRSLAEATRAERIRRQSAEPTGVTSFADLGLYRLLGPGNEEGDLAAFIEEWLGDLIAVDAERGSSLTMTLAHFLDSGGSYAATAESLVVHRSTLRYRLRRIREVSGRDLSDPESRLNLHVAVRAWRVRQGEEH